MRCPYCQNEDSKVIDTTHDTHGGVRRRRECENCHQRFQPYERPILATPLLVKRDGTREEFDREKLTRGIRISCAKRPVSAADIERLVGEIESTLQRMGRAEVPSRVVGDMVINGLKESGFRLLISVTPSFTCTWMISNPSAKKSTDFWKIEDLFNGTKPFPQPVSYRPHLVQPTYRRLTLPITPARCSFAATSAGMTWANLLKPLKRCSGGWPTTSPRWKKPGAGDVDRSGA